MVFCHADLENPRGQERWARPLWRWIWRFFHHHQARRRLARLIHHHHRKVAALGAAQAAARELIRARTGLGKKQEYVAGRVLKGPCEF